MKGEMAEFKWDYAQAVLAFCKPVHLCASRRVELFYMKNKNIAKDDDQQGSVGTFSWYISKLSKTWEHMFL